MRERARAGGDHGGARAARPVRRDRCPGRPRRPPPRRRRGVARARSGTMLAGWTSLAQHALDHGDGLIRTQRRLHLVARASLEAALAGWVARGRIWEASWARLDLAACLLRSNREGEALDRCVRSERSPTAGQRAAAARADELLAWPAVAAPRRSPGGRSPPASSRSRAWSRTGLTNADDRRRAARSRPGRSAPTWSTSSPSSGSRAAPRSRPGWPRWALARTSSSAGRCRRPVRPAARCGALPSAEGHRVGQARDKDPRSRGLSPPIPPRPAPTETASGRRRG